MSSSMMSPFVQQLLFGRVETGGSAAMAQSAGACLSYTLKAFR